MKRGGVSPEKSLNIKMLISGISKSLDILIHDLGSERVDLNKAVLLRKSSINFANENQINQNESDSIKSIARKTPEISQYETSSRNMNFILNRQK